MQRPSLTFIFIVVAMLALPAPGRAADAAEPTSVVVILTATKREMRFIEARVTDPRSEFIEGRQHVTGNLGDRRVAVASTGVGKVNAAIGTALAIERYRPTAVIFVGIAGAIDERLVAGDVVVAERTVQHDVGTMTDGDALASRTIRNPIDGTSNPRAFAANNELLVVARQTIAAKLSTTALATGSDASSVRVGVIATGDTFVASAVRKQQIRDEFAADAVDMETAAAAQACWQAGVPFLAIRGISDRADAKANDDLPNNAARAAENASNLTLQVVANLTVSDSTREASATPTTSPSK